MSVLLRALNRSSGRADANARAATVALMAAWSTGLDSPPLQRLSLPSLPCLPCLPAAASQV